MENTFLENLLIIPIQDKPIKVVIENNPIVTFDKNGYTISKSLPTLEKEKLLKEVFGGTELGIISYDDVKEKGALYDE